MNQCNSLAAWYSRSISPDKSPSAHFLHLQPQRRQTEDPQRLVVPPSPWNHPAALSRNRRGQASFLQAVRCLCFWHHLVRVTRTWMALQESTSRGDHMADRQWDETQSCTNWHGEGDIRYSAPLLGVQARGATQLLQAGRFTGKVAKKEPPPFPPRALLEVSWVCQIS